MMVICIPLEREKKNNNKHKFHYKVRGKIEFILYTETENEKGLGII